MHVHIGFLEFFIFALYYVILKACILFVNLEMRRNQVHIPAAVSGLLS